MKTPKSLNNTKVYPNTFAIVTQMVFQIFNKKFSISVIPTLYNTLNLSQ